MTKITLMRALSKLKTTEKEIEEFFNTDKTPSPLFLSSKKEADSVVLGTTLTVKEFETRAVAQKDKIENLIKLHRVLKRKISEANNTIQVEIRGEKMSITEAIFYKQTIKFKEQLCKRFRKELTDWKVLKEKSDRAIETNAVNLTKQISQEGNSEEDVKERLKQLTMIFSKGLQYTAIDPLQANDVVTNIENEIREFNEEIDFILNEVNSKHEIEVDF
jgi:hypothetical protein